MQLMQTGAKAYYQPDAIIYHKDPQSLVQYLKKILVSAIGSEYFLKKWLKQRIQISHTRFGKQKCTEYINAVYQPSRKENIMLTLLLRGTDRLLQFVPVISHYYE